MRDCQARVLTTEDRVVKREGEHLHEPVIEEFSGDPAAGSVSTGKVEDEAESAKTVCSIYRIPMLDRLPYPRS